MIVANKDYACKHKNRRKLENSKWLSRAFLFRRHVLLFSTATCVSQCKKLRLGANDRLSQNRSSEVRAVELDELNSHECVQPVKNSVHIIYYIMT